MPKQRQTGLFSATQAKAVEKLLKFGLRNPMRMTVSREGEVTLGESLDEAKQEQKAADVAPKELENFYVVRIFVCIFILIERLNLVC